MGGLLSVQSVPGRIGFNADAICEATGTPPKIWTPLWWNLSYDEVWGRKGVAGEEGMARAELFQDMVHGERWTDCKTQSHAFLRETLFEPFKAGQYNPAHGASTFFTTDQISRCWYPWAVPKRLYTTEQQYIDSVVDLAAEYGVHHSRLSYMSAKVDNRGEVTVGIDLPGNPTQA